jgi:hypothetical protein
MFHDQRFLKTIDSRPDCRHKAYDAGHWLAISKADEVKNEIDRFFFSKVN